MLENIEQYISETKFNLAWRFDDCAQVLNNLLILNDEGHDLVWNFLFEKGYTTHDNSYNLESSLFETFEELSFSDDYNKMSDRFQQLSNLEDVVIVTWNTGPSLLTTLGIFIHNWDSFYQPSSDDLFVINRSRHSIFYLSHFEHFQIGY